jgi:cytochrome c-type biogenesis protein CcmH/NrfG
MAAPGLVLPINWLIHYSFVERTISPPIALFAIIAHLAILISLIAIVPVVFIIYCVLVLLAIGLNPFMTKLKDKQSLRQFAESDIQRYQRLIERHPENATAYAALGKAYLQCELYREAVAAFEKSISLDPEQTEIDSWTLKEARENQARVEAESSKAVLQRRVFFSKR